ncbi:MAG: cyd operon protein YbgE [Lonepinella koalarum]|nr:cyd operon protein YbgE [Lonepinella koalarum]
MINTLYQFVNKGSWRALSFILAITLTGLFFFNINGFSTALRIQPPLWVITILWATVILWIHGIGFDIRHILWKVLFFPYIGYGVSLLVLIKHLSNV